ncbi:MAG: prepilin-type N-terminal cleavage/methylation domain-containing protein [Deltaproteobacteria bacterium]|nr:prepilin-type N-terminal cleavage/methylation domain-containing protein [Deltaproteobacteria bacterium]
MRTAIEKRHKKWSCDRGFSLVELVVAMAISLVVMAGVYKVYVTQQDTYLLQEQVAEMQQNARVAKYVLTKDIRMVGYNPTRKVNSPTFQTSFVSKLPDDDSLDSDPDRTSTGPQTVAFTLDDNGDGVLEANFDEQVAFRVDGGNLERFDVDNDSWLMVVENIEALGFAYAFDDNGDGNIDTSPNGFIIWAIDGDDSDTDERLNVNLDGNDDGVIDASDDTNGDGKIDDDDAGTPLATPVGLDKIRAVKIWVLAKTGKSDRRYNVAETYVVGNRLLSRNDQNRRSMVITAVKCRNMAL